MMSDKIGDLSLDDLMGTYYKSRLAAQILEKIQSSYFPSEDQSLDKELKKLDITAKKRMLSIPLSTDDYEMSVNESRPFAQFGKEASLLGAYSAKSFKPLPDMRFFEAPAKQVLFPALNVRDFSPVLKYFENMNKQTKRIPASNLLGVLRYVRK